MNQSALATSIEYTLTVSGGPIKGAKFKLVSDRVSIGRSEDNDVVLDADPRVSRKHAEITLSPGLCVITNCTKKNILYLNGKEIQSEEIKSGDTIKIGKSQLKFKIINRSPSAGAAPRSQVATPQDQDALTGTKPLPQHMHTIAQHSPSTPFPTPSGGGSFQGFNKDDIGPTRKSNGKRSPVFMVLVGLVILSAIYLMTVGKNKIVETDEGLISEEARQLSLEETAKSTADYRDKIEQSGKTSPFYKEAHSHYIKGLRDFNLGVFNRAIESFQACLSIYPQHQQCQKYFDLARRKKSEIVQQNMILGRKYLDKRQYRACANAFMAVMTSLQNSNDKIYQEAKINYTSCRLRMEGL